jgi:protein-tyrosine phosphatase
VLPGVDDGPATTEEALAILLDLEAIGFDTVCATPHQKADQFLPSADEIQRALAATRAAMAEVGLGLSLVLGAENMWDACFYERVEADAIPRYGGSSAFLLEFHLPELPAGLLTHIFRMRTSGMLPVIAHPERYEPLWEAPGLLERLSRDCALVVNLPALAGHQGRRRTKLARAMLRAGTAHAAASDAHSLDDVHQAADGIAWIRKKLGERAVMRLLDENPRRILGGEHPEE